MAARSPIQTIAVVFALFGVLAGGNAAGPIRSLSESEIESAEAKATRDKLLENNEQLREKVALAEASAAKLAESVAIANSEAEVFRRQAGELKLRLEALGVDGSAGSPAKLEQRLLKAVSDLRISDVERKKLSDVLAELSEASLHFVKSAGSADAEARLALEAKMRAANAALGAVSAEAVDASAVNATLLDGMVIAYKDELALVVANVGSRQGVKVGMPFQVLRDEHVIGTVRVIDVREKIAGALIQNLDSDKERIKVGDRLKIAALQ